MDLFLQTVLLGVSNAAVYVLLALGVSIIFGVLHVVNFAHGDFMSVASYTAFAVIVPLGLSPWLGALAIIPAMVVLGVLFFELILRPMAAHDHELQIVVTFGLALTIQGLITVISGTIPKDIQRNVEAWQLGGVAISQVTVINVALSAVGLTALWFVLSRSSIGRDIRASAQDPIGAQIAGVDTRRAQLAGVILSTLLAGAAGFMILQRSSLTPDVGFLFVLKAFAIAIVAGIGRVEGVLVVALLLGIAEALVGTYTSSILGQSVMFVAIIATLLVRPAGLLSAKVRT